MARTGMTRRDLLHKSTVVVASATASVWWSEAARAAAKADAKKAPASLNNPLFREYRYGHMVQEYYVQRLRAITRERRKARKEIRTPEQVAALREDVRRKLRKCFGPRPERTPLEPRVTGKVEREHYTIEKIIYESRPDYLVTANLYVPKPAAERMPAVLGTCGHSRNGKASSMYQEFARNLARQGYVVLIYDPPAQGERTEYPPKKGEPRINFGTMSHNVAGNQMTLCGRNFAFWEAWDGIRGVDYLLSLPYVDPKRLGVTGNSGGGTQSTHLNALEDRFTMAAPSCFVTRYGRNLENEEPTDAEQVIPGMLAEGLDMADFFVAQIPRPVILVGQINDFFDVRGLRETYQELRRLYAAAGAEKNIRLHVGPNQHGYHPDGRKAMYRFFNEHAGVQASPDEPEMPVEPDEVLQVTPKGQTHLLGSRRTFDFTRDKAQQLAKGRKRVAGKALTERVVERLALPQRSRPPHYRVLRARTISSKPKLRDHCFAVETEPRIQALLHAVVESDPVYYLRKGRRVTLYVAHRSGLKEAILGQVPEDPDTSIRYALDVRGIGELTARTSRDSGDDFFHYYHSDFMYSNHGLMLREPYCGRRVHDVLRVIDLFKAKGYEEVHLVGRGLGAISATFAAVVHPLVTRVTLHNALLSYHELAQTPRYAWPFSSMVFGVLENFDLPDCLRELATHKKLALVDPWDARMRLWSKSAIADHLKTLGLDGLKIGWSA